MKPLVIYHKDCADGFGAAFAAWHKLGDEAQYLPWQYADAKNETEEQEWDRLSAAIAPEPNGGRVVYILDFSFRRGIMNKLFDVSERVVWLDHHASSRVIAEQFCDAKD